MKFIIKKEALIEKLQKVIGPTTTKQNFPILNSILISVVNDTLTLTTTDLDIIIITNQKVHVIEEGSCAVLMNKLFSIIRELPFSDIVIESNKSLLLIKCDKIEFKINAFDPEEFPKREEKKKSSLIKVNPKDLEEMIRLTSFCVNREDNKHILSGVFFEIVEDSLKLIATDGRRLAYIKRKLPKDQAEIKTRIAFILPIKAVMELHKLIKEREEEIFMFLEHNKIGFDFKDSQFISSPIEGDFIDYSKYIFPENKEKLVINREVFLSALRRADLLSTLDFQGVKLEVKKESLVISKNTPQLGEVKEVLVANYSGAPLQIGFNTLYLLEVVRSLEDENIAIEFLGPEKPAVIRKENYSYTIASYKV